MHRFACIFSHGPNAFANPVTMIKGMSYFCVLAAVGLMSVTQSCRKPSQPTYQEFSRRQDDALHMYARGKRADAAAKLHDVYEYGLALSKTSHIPNSNSLLAVIAGREAFVYADTGQDRQLTNALERVRHHLQNVRVKGEDRQGKGRLSAFMHVVAEFDRGMGVTSSVSVSIEQTAENLDAKKKPLSSAF